MEPKSTHQFSIAPADVAHEFAHPQPPVAARKPVEHRLHGDLRLDDYAWLREKDNPDVIRHLEAENAYSKAVLQPTEAFQEKLYQEMLSRIQQTDLTVPYQLRGHFYFTKTLEGKQYPLHYRRSDNDSSVVGEQQVAPQLGTQSSDTLLLDFNPLPECHSFLAPSL